MNVPGHAPLRRAALILAQIGLLWMLSLLGSLIANALHLPLPGNLVGMLLLFFLLICRAVPLRWFERGADALLSILVYLFIPATVGVMNYGRLFAAHGAAIVITVAVSTIATLLTTASASSWLAHKGQRKERGVPQ